MTKRNKISKFISGLRVAINSPRCSMVNIQYFAKFFFGNSTALTGKIVSYPSLFRLSFPVLATIINSPTKPSRTISSFLKVRVLKPVILTRNATECMLAALAWGFHYYLPAGLTQLFYPAILRMFYSRDSVLFTILRKTLMTTEKVLKGISTAVRPDKWFPAIRAGHFYSHISCLVSASCGAILLVGVISRWLECFTAQGTTFWEYFAPGFIGTGYRAEANYAVSSLFNRIITILTSFHHYKYKVIEGVCQV